jgi:hypothetical protein
MSFIARMKRKKGYFGGEGDDRPYVTIELEKILSLLALKE